MAYSKILPWGWGLTVYLQTVVFAADNCAASSDCVSGEGCLSTTVCGTYIYLLILWKIIIGNEIKIHFVFEYRVLKLLFYNIIATIGVIYTSLRQHLECIGNIKTI